MFHYLIAIFVFCFYCLFFKTNRRTNKQQNLMKMYDPLFCFAKTAPDHKQAPIFQITFFFAQICLRQHILFTINILMNLYEFMLKSVLDMVLAFLFANAIFKWIAMNSVWQRTFFCNIKFLK